MWLEKLRLFFVKCWLYRKYSAVFFQKLWLFDIRYVGHGHTVWLFKRWDQDSLLVVIQNKKISFCRIFSFQYWADFLFVSVFF